MFPNVITQQDDLTAFVEHISSSPWLALDTEFMRESTYYPELCLIQVAANDVSSCIDVFSLENIEPLINLLKQTQQHKIIHSCRQDLEVFYSHYQFIPQPLFDTQIAASILGLDEQISYAELVAQICSIQLAKTESRTDWKRRPLSTAQIDYALDDVNHLGALYQQLDTALKNKNRNHWLLEECEQLTDPNKYIVQPENAWQLVKGLGKLNAQQFYYLRGLANWRETAAQTKNLPRRWLLNDTAMIELCQLQTYSDASISNYLKQNAPKSQRHYDMIKNILQKSIASNAINKLPEPDTHRLTREQRLLVKSLMETTRQKATQLETSASLLANRKSLVNLVLGKPSKVTSGWRHDEIGTELNAQVSDKTVELDAN